MTPQQIKLQKFVSSFYKNVDGSSLVLTPTQVELFENIFYKTHPLNITIAFTRYGKSLTTALAVLTRCLFYPEKWAIIAPTEKQAKIIMNYIIEHLFDNEFISPKLQLEAGESLERLRRERSKKRLTFKIFESNQVSEIYILSAHSTKEDPLKGLLGFGAENIVLDESALIDDKVYVGILRMLGDSKEPFLFELGNPIKRNHFFDSYNNPKYHKIVIDYQKGLEEGRITQEQVDLMRDKPYFDVLYECKFPESYGVIVNKEEQLIFTNKGAADCDLFAIGTDLAVSEKEEADYSAIVVTGRLKGTNKMIVISSKFGRWGMNEMINLIKSDFDFYKRYGIILIGVEDVAYQREFGKELERRYLLSPTYVKRTTDKRSRLLMLNPYFVNHQIEFFGDKTKFEDLLDQLINFETVEHDDLADAFEMSISLIKDYLLKESPQPQPLPEEKQMIKDAIQELLDRQRGGPTESYNY